MAEFILKDRNGKDRTFDKETIYVQGTDGELKSFTHGVSEPVVQPLNVTENGEYPVPDGVDGFAPVTVNVPDIPAVIHPLSITENGTYTAPANVDGYNPIVVEVEPETSEIILNETHLAGFASDPNFGGLYASDYAFGSDIDFFEIVEGQEYIVHWDGNIYSTTAKDASAVLPGALYLGNGTLMGLEGNGEPFAIGCTSQGVTFFGLTDPASEHDVAIIKRVRHEDILLQDKTITENGKYTADDVYDGLGEVIVAVHAPEVKLQDKTITENGEYTADSGFDGLGKVLVDVAGSGGDASDGAPFMKMVGSIVTNQNKTNVNTTVTLSIPKNAKIIRAWSTQLYNINKTYCSIFTYLTPLDVKNLTLDTSNATYDQVSYVFKSGYGSTVFSSYNTFVLRVLVATDAITVKNAGDGLCAGTVNRCDTPIYTNSNDISVEQIMYLKSLDFAEGITHVPDYACYNQIFLEQVNWSKVKTIGNSAFYGCTSLTGELILPNTITEIPMSAFGNTKFDRVVFPEGLKNIAMNAFVGCTHPTEYDFSACTTVPTLSFDDALGRVGNGQVLKIPFALFSSWSTATNWSSWASQMVAV